MSDSRRRVVITGLGAITPVGKDVPSTWGQLLAGESGAGPITLFETTDALTARIACEVKDFDPTEHIDISSKEVRRLDRFCQFALVAADKAIKHSGIDFSVGDSFRHGTLIGSGIGGLSEIETQHSKLFDRGPKRVSAFMIPKLMVNAASGNVSVRWGLRGPNSAVATACASATNAIGDAFKLIQNDMADVMVTGGSEAPITPMGLSGFSRMNALSTRNEDPQRASRPFDIGRNGFVLGEGAGFLVLEDWDAARRRGARIYAELAGDGNSLSSLSPTSRS